MSDVLVLGAGLNGLCAAVLLARDGHRVTVLERDAAEPPEPGAAWEHWERRGCAQFRLPHFMQTRWRHLLEAELPELARAVVAAGGTTYNIVDELPAERTGGRRPGDERFDTLTARRPVVEAAAARLAADEPGVEVRRGTAVTALLTGPSDAAGVPHVCGVVTADGEELRADLVVDTTGRSAAVRERLTAAGAAPPLEERQDGGLAYYGRHFRGRDGRLPALRGALQQHYDSASVLTLPADDGTWSVTVAVSAHDTALRGLRDPERWAAAVRRYPLVAHWIDADPITDGVAVMAGIEDRVHRTVVDGCPVATGLLLAGDARACTDPAIGRGTSIGLLDVLALRDAVREVGPDAPRELALRADALVAERVEPWFRATVHSGRSRLAEIEANRRGEPADPDPVWRMTTSLMAAAGADPDALRAVLDIAGVLEAPPQVLARPGLVERVSEVTAGLPRYVLPGPDRAGLLAAVA